MACARSAASRCGKYAEVEAARAEERVKLTAYRREKEIDRYQRHEINEFSTKAEKARMRGRGR